MDNNRVRSHAPTQPPGTLKTFTFFLAAGSLREWVARATSLQAPALDLRHAPALTSCHPFFGKAQSPPSAGRVRTIHGVVKIIGSVDRAEREANGEVLAAPGDNGQYLPGALRIADLVKTRNCVDEAIPN